MLATSPGLGTMVSRFATDNKDYPKPWEHDERLQHVTFSAEINRVVRLVIRFALAMAEAPVGAIPMAETIPKLWESVKDLRPENITNITKATIALGGCTAQAKKETDSLFTKEYLARKRSVRERENDEENSDPPGPAGAPEEAPAPPESMSRAPPPAAAGAAARLLSDSFQCPLTMEVMRDPVMTTDGQTYERMEIERWFALGNRTSPLTGAELPCTLLFPNIALRNAIQDAAGA